MLGSRKNKTRCLFSSYIERGAPIGRLLDSRRRAKKKGPVWVARETAGRGSRSWRAKALVLAGFFLWACGGRAGLIEDGAVSTAASGGGTVASSSSAGGTGGGGSLPLELDKVDLLLVVDNSRGTSSKSNYIATAVDRLVGWLVNPPCVDGQGRWLDTPDEPAAPCQAGTTRIFAPVADLHIGIVTSSLGSNGADTCTDFPANQRARLLAQNEMSQKVPTYRGLGFLAWDPAQQKAPAGEDEVDELQERLETMMAGVGAEGCGFEASHEAWYRFLVEPEPYEDIEVMNGSAQLVGVDKVILQQRREFLRPDSLLVIVPISDENDCSIRAGGQYFLAMQRFIPGTNQAFQLPRARAACETDPNGPCCRSCAQPPGAGCDTSKDQCTSNYSALEDAINVRCWQQKRRFGLDFRYPIERYRTGLQSAQVMDSRGEVRNNPLFLDLKDPASQPNPSLGGRRVLYSPIVGVPWQDLARRTATGEPDLEEGLDAQGSQRGMFQSAAELRSNDTWALILGDPQRYHLMSGWPRDPFMVESVEPRSGTHPITGDAISPVNALHDANAINGHETDFPSRDQLQTSCLSMLAQPTSCPDTGFCCDEPSDAACQNPDTEQATPAVLYRYRAWPGIRQLDLAEQLGENIAVGSLCSAPESDPDEQSYGLNPSVHGIIDAASRWLR